jgi:hypothetical protein
MVWFVDLGGLRCSEEKKNDVVCKNKICFSIGPLLKQSISTFESFMDMLIYIKVWVLLGLLSIKLRSKRIQLKVEEQSKKEKCV